MDRRGPSAALPPDWMFQVVFDYGDHTASPPTPEPDQPWPLGRTRSRPIAPASRSGPTGACSGSLFFNNFPDEPDGGANCLVRSLDLAYSDQQSPADPAQSDLHIARLRHADRLPKDGGHLGQPRCRRWSSTYSQPASSQTVCSLDRDSLANLPEGIDGTRFHWVDLDGEGLSGILTEPAGLVLQAQPQRRAIVAQPTAALAHAAFGPLEIGRRASVRSRPVGGRQLLRPGRRRPLDVVDLAGPDPGFFKRTDDDDFEPLQRFASLPQIDWANPNIKFVDLTGDGLADVLITEDGALHLSPLARRGSGFDAARAGAHAAGTRKRARKSSSPTAPRRSSSPTCRGDGLTDIVRVRNGEVCYWPNLGYGRFGAKVTMDDAPRFDNDRARSTRSASAWPTSTASGTTDIIYIGDDGVALYFNQSGNAWARRTPSPSSRRADTSSTRQADRSARHRHGVPGLVVAAARRRSARRCATST